MYDTLATENAQLRKTIVELSEMCSDNLQMSRKIKDLEKLNKKLTDQVEAANLQVTCTSSNNSLNHVIMKLWTLLILIHINMYSVLQCSCNISHPEHRANALRQQNMALKDLYSV